MTDLKKELSTFSQHDIYFLKSKWREWITKKQFKNFEEIDQKPNVLFVYNILDPQKIISIESARNGFSGVRTKHSKDYDIVIILQINNERIEIMTYYKESTQRREGH